jgi:hypothetical protein
MQSHRGINNKATKQQSKEDEQKPLMANDFPPQFLNQQQAVILRPGNAAARNNLRAAIAAKANQNKK